MALTPDDIKSIFEALNESDWDEAVVEVGDVRIAVSRNGHLNAADSPGVAPSGAGQESLAAAPASPALPSAPAPTPTPHPVPPAATPALSSAADDVTVEAPSVGVFWRASDPSADPFVEVGAHVEVGDTLCIVEVMKLMSNVAAPVAGTVTAILIENGHNVEHGTPLFTVRPDVR